MKAPLFWQKPGLLASILWPFTLLYRGLSALRTLITTPYHASLPVICIGNITSGGTGKTPVTRYLAEVLTRQGYHPVILMRGYGGTLSGPLLYDGAQHDARQVGDEACLLGQSCDVVISRDRKAGAHLIESLGKYDVILMDDGLQNPSLAKTMSLLIFDGAVGVQNNYHLPSGPLRTSLKGGKKVADFALINGEDKTSLMPRLAPLPVATFTLQPDDDHIARLKERPVIAFAGIGRPQRFFNMLRDKGLDVKAASSFADHHRYQETELQQLTSQAAETKARCLTTEKDWVRLPKDWQNSVDYCPVSLQIDAADEAQLLSHITKAMAKHVAL